MEIAVAVRVHRSGGNVGLGKVAVSTRQNVSGDRRCGERPSAAPSPEESALTVGRATGRSGVNDWLYACWYIYMCCFGVLALLMAWCVHGLRSS